MSCTGAANWKRWALKIQIQTASLSGRVDHAPQRERVCKATKQLKYQLPKSLLFRNNNFFSYHSCSLQETYEAKRKEFLGDLQRKEEEMRQMFVNKVKETEAELKEKEREVCEKCFAVSSGVLHVLGFQDCRQFLGSFDSSCFTNFHRTAAKI